MDPLVQSLLIAVPMVLWFLASVAVASVAGKRGQSAVLWFLIAIVATPFLAALLLFALTRPPEPGRPA